MLAAVAPLAAVNTCHATSMFTPLAPADTECFSFNQLTFLHEDCAATATTVWTLAAWLHSFSAWQMLSRQTSLRRGSPHACSAATQKC